MNNSLKILFLSLLTSFSSVQAQNMLQQGNQWLFEYTTTFAPWPGQSIESITIQGDTIINQVHYSKLVLTESFPCLFSNQQEFLREEGNKIFRWNQTFQQEFLIIDFGETVEYALLYEYGSEIDTGIVLIDSFGVEISPNNIAIDVQYMKIINNQSYDDSTIYKVYRDIGFINPGFLIPDLGTGLCDPVWSWATPRCYISGVDTIHFTEFDCYESSIINATHDLMFHEVSLFPNPATDRINIPSGLIFKDITNMSGQSYKTEFDENTIYLSDLSPGLYILRFVSLNGREIYVGDIVKI